MRGAAYALPAVLAVLAVIALELFVLRTGLFRKLSYWLSMAIVFGFQVLVDGWLTKLNDPIVVYAPEHLIGVRVPWDIPVEDFAFGFAMVTAVLLLWERQRPPDRPATEPATRPAAEPATLPATEGVTQPGLESEPASAPVRRPAAGPSRAPSHQTTGTQDIEGRH